MPTSTTAPFPCVTGYHVDDEHVQVADWIAEVLGERWTVVRDYFDMTTHYFMVVPTSAVRRLDHDLELVMELSPAFQVDFYHALSSSSAGTRLEVTPYVAPGGREPGATVVHTPLLGSLSDGDPQLLAEFVDAVSDALTSEATSTLTNVRYLNEHEPQTLVELGADAGCDPATLTTLARGWAGSLEELLTTARSLGPA